MAVDLLCMGEPMLEFNQLPPQPDGRVLYLEGHGGDTSNAAIAAARQGARVGYITAIGNDAPGESLHGAVGARGGRYRPRVIRTDRALTGGVFRHARRATGITSCTTAGTRPPRCMRRPTCRGTRSRRRGCCSPPASARASRPAPPTRCSPRSTLARGAGGKVAYDTNYRPRLWPPARAAAVMHAAIAQADYVFPGLEDAAVLTGLTDPDAILDFYLRLGPTVVVLKMGGGRCLSRHAGPPRPHPAASGRRGRCHRRRRCAVRQLPGAHAGGRRAGGGGALCGGGRGTEMHRLRRGGADPVRGAGSRRAACRVTNNQETCHVPALRLRAIPAPCRGERCSAGASRHSR